MAEKFWLPAAKKAEKSCPSPTNDKQCAGVSALQEIMFAERR
jgi:hypothetical protein